jgi:glycosyltransferase involved in cell wall biosynthesis
MSVPTVSAVLTVYNGERYLCEALDAVLSQTSPPDEVVVVDDGSTDGTARLLEGYGSAIRVVQQPNAGHPAGFNRGFREARCEYLARCDADDIWSPHKLECQRAALEAHPEVDICFAAARTFGRIEQPFSSHPGSGILASAALASRLYRRNMVCSSSVVIRRATFERLGPFCEPLITEDYEYWMRALKAGAVFFYEPRTLVSYRLHDSNVTNKRLRSYRSLLVSHERHADLPGDPRLVRSVLAADHFMLGRFLVDEDRPREARHEFALALRGRRSLRGLAWMALLCSPARARRRLGDAAVAVKRTLRPERAQRTMTGL